MSDVLTLEFSSTFAWQSHLIRIMTNSPFSHVNLSLEEGLLGASDPGGVMIRGIDYEPMMIRQRCVIRTPKAQAIIALIKSQIGKPFDDTALHSFFHQPTGDNPTLMRDWRELSKWYCCEIICWAMEAEGFWPYPILTPENRVTPPFLLALLNPFMDIAAWHASKIEMAKPT